VSATFWRWCVKRSRTWVLTLFLYAAPNASSVWVRFVEEVSSAIAEIELTGNLPAGTPLLSPPAT